MESTTLTDLFLKHVSARPDEVALRHKKNGIWQEITWSDYCRNVEAVCLGFLELGLSAGERVVYITDNRPEWVYWELGAMSARLIPFGIYPDNTNLEEIAYLIRFSETKLVLCEDQEQVDKILAIYEEIPDLQRIVVIEEREVIEYTDPLLLSYKEFIQIGAACRRHHPNLFRESVKKTREDDIAFFSLTSGTTARPKLAMLTHRNLLSLGNTYQEVDPAEKDFDFISFLPTAWIGERMTSIVRALRAGFRLNFPESPETALRDMREIGPSLIFSPPRLWQQMHRDLSIRIAESSWLKRVVYNRCIRIAVKFASRGNDRQTLTFSDKFFYRAVDMLVLRKLRDHLGLSRIVYLYTGGAAIGTDLFLFFLAIGVKIKQAYGLTESGAIAALQRSDDIRLETVGPAAPGVDIKISEEGEILVRGDNVFLGYFNQPEETEKVLKDGWLWSGDKGYLDENNHLIMIDRFGEVMRLSDGGDFSPQFIENKLKFSMYINEAIVVGHEKDYVAALIQINMKTVAKWAEDHSLTYTTFSDIAQKRDVYELIRREVDQANLRLPEIAKIKRFVLLQKELDSEGGDLTQTQKMRRRFVIKKYKHEIDQLYAPVDRSGINP
jgi:long-chain acyl-CoA synthetase